MTASAVEGERERCLEAGMDDFLTKPVDIAAVERVVRRWTDGRGRAAATTAPATAPATAAAAPTPAGDPTRAVLDLDRVEMLAEMVKDGQSLFHRSSGNFLAGLAEQLDTIEAAVVGRDAETLTSAAHKFKGSALNLGLPGVGAVAQELELAGQAGDFGNADDAVARLRAESEKAVGALTAERDRRI